MVAVALLEAAAGGRDPRRWQQLRPREVQLRRQRWHRQAQQIREKAHVLIGEFVDAVVVHHAAPR